MITAAQMVSVNNKIRESFTRGLGYVPDYKLVFRQDMKKCAGRMHLSECLIELNEQLFINNTDTFMNDTIPHECAHYCVYRNHPRAKQFHGPEFKMMARIIGFSGSTYHSMNTSPALDMSKYFKYTCGCDGREHFLSRLIHGKVQSKIQTRKCKLCSTLIKYTP